MSNTSSQALHKFLSDVHSHGVLQNQAMYEFRYPILFENDSFLIEQVNFPKLDTNVGYIYLDGYRIPVHSAGQFDNEISFTMYAEESNFLPEGKYFKVFDSILDINHKLVPFDISKSIDSAYTAKIIPLSTKYNAGERNSMDSKSVIVLYNALIKSITLSGGFSSNSQALAKFDVTVTYAFFDNYFNKNLWGV